MPYIPSDSEEKQISLIEPGQYLAQVRQVKEIDKEGKLNKDKNGDEYWSIEFVIITEGKFYEKNIWDKIIFSDKLKSRTKAIFNAFGFDTSKGMIIENGDLLVGRIALIDIINEPYNGVTQSKIKFFGGYHKMGGTKNKEEEPPF